jgi:hypothetical protein
MFCILAELLLFFARVGFAANGNLAAAGIVAIVYFVVAITAAVFIFMLAISLYNTGVGVLLGILTLIPLIGLLVLLVVNSKATKLLREHGLKVGLMGAKLPKV